jgi:hypothetical protein
MLKLRIAVWARARALVALWTLLVLASGPLSSTQAETFCLDYRWKPNPANLVLYDFSILDLQAEPDLRPGHAAGKKFFSYLSIGEIAGDAPYLADAQARGISMVSENTEWSSYYPDIADPKWADFVIQVLAPAIIAKGFDGFFLDTVDSVDTLSRLNPLKAADYRAGMISLIGRLKQSFPDKEIILNHGFTVFDAVKDCVKGVMVEELFQKDDYSARPANEVAYIVARLGPITAAGKSVYVVDYVPESNLPLAQETAARISSLGFNPVVIPRRIDGTVLAPTVQPPPTEIDPGTIPDPNTRILMRRSTSSKAVKVGFDAVPGKSYTIQYRDAWDSGGWREWQGVAPVDTARRIEFYDFDNHSGKMRYYRLRHGYPYPFHCWIAR